MRMPSKIKSDVERVVNRHIARLLEDLEDVQCPKVFIEAVKSELRWLRSDIVDLLKDLKGNIHDRNVPTRNNCAR